MLTKLPFLVFFEKLTEFLVFKLLPLPEDQLQLNLEKLQQQSQKWPEPEPLVSYILPVLDYQIPVDIPNYIYDLSGSALIKVENYSSSKQKKTEQGGKHSL